MAPFFFEGMIVLRGFFGVLFLLLIAGFFVVYQQTHYYNMQRVVVVFVFYFVGFFYLNSAFSGGRLGLELLVVLLLLGLLFLCGGAYRWVSVFLGILGFSTVLYKIDFDVLCSSVAIFLLGLSFIVFEFYATSYYYGVYSLNAIFAAFVNVRFFADVIVVCFPFLLGGYLSSSRSLSRAFFAFVAVCVLGLGIFSGSRALLLGLFVAMTIVFLFAKGFRAQVAIFCGLALIGALLQSWLMSNYFFLRSVPVVSSSDILRSVDGLSGRWVLWGAALGGWLENPFYGVGEGRFACLSGVGHAHPHFFLLQVLVEQGLFALLAFLICLLWFFKQAVKDAQAKVEPVSLVVLAAYTGAGVMSFFSGVLLMPISQFFFVLMLGLGLSRWQLPSFLVNRKVVFLVCLIIAVLVVLAMGEMKNDLELQAKLLQPQNGMVVTDFIPGYWINGKSLCQ